jgi:transcriptional regulator with XRE-family HTH domain
MTEATERKVHQGRNVKRFREMLGIKQEALAQQLGEDWTQKKISLLEAKEEIEPALLEQVAKVMKVPVKAIENFDEQAAIVYFNTFNDNSFSNSNGTFNANNCTFNPIDKVVELYERMLKDKNEMIDRLEKMLQERK